MTPEQRIQQLEAQVATLTSRMNQLMSNNTIPLEVDRAFRARLKISNLQEKITDLTSDFPANPLSVVVDEGGASSYRVMDQPDYVLKVRLAQYGSLTVAVPAFDY